MDVFTSDFVQILRDLVKVWTIFFYQVHRSVIANMKTMFLFSPQKHVRSKIEKPLTSWISSTTQIVILVQKYAYVVSPSVRYTLYWQSMSSFCSNYLCFVCARRSYSFRRLFSSILFIGCTCRRNLRIKYWKIHQIFVLENNDKWKKKINLIICTSYFN